MTVALALVAACVAAHQVYGSFSIWKETLAPSPRFVFCCLVLAVGTTSLALYLHRAQRKVLPVALSLVLVLACFVFGSGDPIPLPGSGKGRARFASNDQVEALRPLVDEFWSEILGTSYATSFVSNESQLISWDHYVSGGRPELIRRVKEKYGVDISACYDEPIPAILRRIRDASA